jgi:DNA-binding CsgD family transcriptional regulator
MLAAAAARRITPAHRRRLADALVAAPDTGVDIVRRAMWQVDTTAVPDVDLLLAGARAVFLTRPSLALRLAERALPFDDGPRAALLVADAHAELGDIDRARQAQARAAESVRDDADQVAVRLNQVSLTAFSDRRPDIALDVLVAAIGELPDQYRPELESMAAQITLFSARPADALALAERVLSGSPPRHCRIRASSVRVLALALVDRSTEALAAAEALLADVAGGPTSPYAQGVAHIAALGARFVYWANQYAPATDPSGRWPVPATTSDLTPHSESVFYPLFDGARRLLEGRADTAVASLREAVAQQRVGEGLLRSEAVALLVVALAATGHGDEAERLLADVPPDGVALYSGLRPWAESAVAAAAGRPEAVALAFDAFEQARAAGSPINAIAYLAAAARYGAVERAAAALDDWGHQFDSPISHARAVGIRARANGDPKALLDAAEQHAAIGVVGDALTLAELAVAAFGPGRSDPATRAAELTRALRDRLRRPDSAADRTSIRTANLTVPLTRRELEVATLAATGLSDRDVADVLVVSVRTVESHLGSVYRKLGIASRRALRDALQRSS